MSDNLQQKHVDLIYKVCKLIDSGAPASEIDKARKERDAIVSKIRKTSKNYDKGYC